MWLLLVSLLFAAPTDKSTCRPKELERLDCRLSLGTHKVRLLRETIVRDDGVWHMVDPMPLKIEGVVWEKISLTRMGLHAVIQLYLWDKGEGEAQVQSLRWYVAALDKARLEILAEGVVRRRRAKEGGFIYDAYEKHGLKALKNGALEWTLGSQTRTLKGS